MFFAEAPKATYDMRCKAHASAFSKGVNFLQHCCFISCALHISIYARLCRSNLDASQVSCCQLGPSLAEGLVPYHHHHAYRACKLDSKAEQACSSCIPLDHIPYLHGGEQHLQPVRGHPGRQPAPPTQGKQLCRRSDTHTHTSATHTVCDCLLVNYACFNLQTYLLVRKKLFFDGHAGPMLNKICPLAIGMQPTSLEACQLSLQLLA